MIRVVNFTSRNGNKVANQFWIHTAYEQIFQSYDSIIAVKNINGTVLLDEFYWDYSKTTGTYSNLFLNESKAETQRKIDSGEYKLVDLQNYRMRG